MSTRLHTAGFRFVCQKLMTLRSVLRFDLIRFRLLLPSENVPAFFAVKRQVAAVFQALTAFQSDKVEKFSIGQMRWNDVL